MVVVVEGWGLMNIQKLCLERLCGKLLLFFPSLCAFWALSGLPVATMAPAAALICLALGVKAS